MKFYKKAIGFFDSLLKVGLDVFYSEKWKKKRRGEGRFLLRMDDYVPALRRDRACHCSDLVGSDSAYGLWIHGADCDLVDASVVGCACVVPRADTNLYVPLAR